jgi:hypothetical protein
MRFICTNVAQRWQLGCNVPEKGKVRLERLMS